MVELFTVLLESTARLLRHHTARTLDSTRFMFKVSKILVRAQFFKEKERQRDRRSRVLPKKTLQTLKCLA